MSRIKPKYKVHDVLCIYGKMYILQDIRHYLSTPETCYALIGINGKDSYVGTSKTLDNDVNVKLAPTTAQLLFHRKVRDN